MNQYRLDGAVEEFETDAEALRAHSEARDDASLGCIEKFTGNQWCPWDVESQNWTHPTPMTHSQKLDLEARLTHFIVVGPGYWGKGKSLKEAKANCMKEGCRAKEKMIAYWGSVDIGMSDGYVTADNLLRIGEI